MTRPSALDRRTIDTTLTSSGRLTPAGTGSMPPQDRTTVHSFEATGEVAGR